MSILIRAIALFSVLVLSACGGDPNEDLNETPVAIGDFRLGHVIAFGDNIQRTFYSRELPPDQIERSVSTAIERRLRRYDGDGLYHLGIVLGGIVLAQPGIPTIATPSSQLLIDINIYDNETRQKLNDEPARLRATEGKWTPLIGSGLARDSEAQLENLSNQIAIQIERWLENNPQWFEPKPGRERVPYDPADFIGVDNVNAGNIASQAEPAPDLAGEN